ncbi:transcription termination factor 2 [Megalopta genalis]|uniref:transcription termination factor 2 n=1 Tax=Megalopta genalis TaxID=115081 RepID=UPI003FD5E891
MDNNFDGWCVLASDSDEDIIEGRSFVISDSDEDIIEDVDKEVFVIESSGSSKNCSRSLTPERRAAATRKSLLTEDAIRQSIKKHILSYPTNEEEDSYVYSRLDSTSWSEEDDEVVQNNAINKKTKTEERFQDSERMSVHSNSGDSENESHDISMAKERNSDSSIHSLYMNTEDEPISLNSSSSGENEMEYEIAISLAKQEIGVGNIDPLVAQKRALLVCKMEHLQKQLSRSKLLLEAGDIDLLPDGGRELRENITKQEEEIKKITLELENTPLTQNIKEDAHAFEEEVQFVNEEFSDIIDVDNIPIKFKSSSHDKELNKKAQAALDKELALTTDRLQDLHGSLIARPSEDERAEDPEGLNVKLMPHQQHALLWLQWRERQKPAGGVLADDMGLGKTLTMISLILSGITNKGLKDSNNCSDDEWADSKTPSHHKGGTLVVCPASLLSQWEKEIRCRCKRGMLAVEVYHGSNRENVPKRLARNDVVITTYNILSREFKTKATTYKIYWERVILDEAHVIRNHKSNAAEAVHGLVSKKRWALTGTPIQNKELDLYSILKFIKCSPFDDIRVWKRWVDNKNTAGRRRLATLMETLMLRRTKQGLQAKGSLASLPDKCVEEVLVKLDPQEQLVYEKVLIYSRTLFAQFLAQRADKNHMHDLASGRYNKPSFLSNPNKKTQFTKAQNRLLSMHADVKTHEILVLLLRLRQICVHPSLIHSMLDQEDMQDTGLTDADYIDPNLFKIDDVALNDEDDANTSGQEIGVDRRVAANVLTSENPVFQIERVSSKMQAVLKTVKEILKKGDKLIIISQWTSMLNIVAAYLPSLKGATFEQFTGDVPIKNRQGIMDAFNNAGTDPKILLLSLTAGGVGLNLVGGNHILLIDIHWNPQLEVQAQDRIYRFGQKKDVYIYKFICKDTIEERIKHLQEKKLEIAANVLSGDKNSTVSKLTLNDLKSLFDL